MISGFCNRCKEITIILYPEQTSYIILWYIEFTGVMGWGTERRFGKQYFSIENMVSSIANGPLMHRPLHCNLLTKRDSAGVTRTIQNGTRALHL